MRTSAPPKHTFQRPKFLSPIMAICLVFAVLTILYGGTKAASEYYVYQAENSNELAIAEKYYQRGFDLDADNAGSRYYLAARFASEHDYTRAAKLLREAIDRGLGVSLTYSLLAKYQILTGDLGAAESSFNESLRIFPNSVFLRIRYALFLEQHARPAESVSQLEYAKKIDARQANGWYSLIKDGSVAAFYKSQSDKDMAPPADLLPETAKYDFIDDRTGKDGKPTHESEQH